MKCLIKIIVIIIFPLLLFLQSSPKGAYAAASTRVDATVQIGVCGNSTAENGEECDNGDLRGKTCQSLGLGSGPLSCDISCSYNTSACYAVITTPTPTVVHAPESAVTNAPVYPTIQISQQAPTVTQIVQPTFLASLFTPAKAFPQKLFYFGANSAGQIGRAQMHDSIQLWVDQWKMFLAQLSVKNGKVTGQTSTAQCDINNDKTCDLVDLSIMFYHVK